MTTEATLEEPGTSAMAELYERTSRRRSDSRTC